VKLGRGVDALSVAAAKVAISLWVLWAGFRAVSDDDYARILIAQRFAESPSLDPSGTSWLPLPFWIYGSAFAAFGTQLGVARAVAIALGVGSVLMVWQAAHWLGVSRTGALLGALLTAAFPWSAWLGAAPLPEAPTAGLLVLGMAGLASFEPRRRLLGASAIAAACFSRYEAWPVALAFAAISLFDARRAVPAAVDGGSLPPPPADSVSLGRFAGPAGARWPWLVAATLALIPIMAWLAHGMARHGDAIFFWKRVAGYRDALGGGLPLISRLLGVPAALVREEPGLVLLLLVLVPFTRPLIAYRRPLLAAGALLTFLLAGEIGGGGPTHHSARALLPLWYLAAVIVGDAVGRRMLDPTRRAGVWLAAPLTLIGGSLWVVGTALPHDFVDRTHALDVGARARELGASRLLIDTPDFSHLAVAVAFARPSAADPLDDHDPRHPRAADAFANETALQLALAQHDQAWLVASRAHARIASAIGRVRAENADYLLVEPTRP
jgi:hypothetical protein